MMWIKSGQCVSHVGLPATTVLCTVCTVLCMLTAASVAEREEGQPVVVNTRYGALRGARKTIGPDSHVDVFHNIPYAKPPIGYLRFHKPVVSEAWTGIRDAMTLGPWCPQPPFNNNFNETYLGQEDCLYLNVYTPKIAADSAPLPVMVWIHGGAYYIGTSNLYNATQLASRGVVVVTINYRLGALGFLSTQDGASPGNYGLWDQVRALQWVRDVISAFNGDPNDVTIFGESAGSTSVSLLVLSKEARGLFTKAIMESGVSLAHWAVGYPDTQPQPREIALKLASRLGCHIEDSNEIVACLKTKDPESIVNVSAALELENNQQIVFRPVAETTFGQYGLFSAAPEVILKNGWFNNVTVIRGFNKDEDGELLKTADDDGFTMEEFVTITRNFVETIVRKPYNLDTDRILDLVIDTYVRRPNVTDPKQLRAVYLQLWTDFDFIAPTYREQLMYFNAHGKMEYLYRFSFRSSNRVNEPWKGVVHGDELVYVFGLPLTNMDPNTVVRNFVSGWTDDDRRVSEQMVTLWTNFAKYGNPTPDGSDGPKWLPWTQTTPRYLDLGTQSTMVSAPETAGMRLWNDIIPNLRDDLIG